MKRILLNHQTHGNMLPQRNQWAHHRGHRMLKKIGLALLLLTGSALAQGAPTLIDHKITTTSNPASVTLNAAGANAIIVSTDRWAAGTPTDDAGDTFFLLGSYNGVDTNIQIYAALGITGHNGEVVSITTDYNNLGFMAIAAGNVASLDQITSSVYAAPSLSITPARPNELVLGFYQGTFNATPSIAYSGSPTPTTLDMGPTANPGSSGGYAFSDASVITGSGTPSPVSMTVTNNQYNGEEFVMMSLASTASPLPLTVTPSTLPHGMRTAAYPITASNISAPSGQAGPFAQTCITPAGGAAPYTVAQTGGSLPPGLTLGGAPNWCITGTPTTSGTYAGIVFTVTDHAGVTTPTAPLTVVIDPLTTTLDLHHPKEGFVLFPGAVRHLGVYEANPGATGKVDYTVTGTTSAATLSCTTNCVGTLTVTATGPAGDLTVGGSPGFYTITGCTDFSVTATSRDQNEDGTYSSSTAPFHICKGNHLVDVQPSYNQAFFGQNKILYGYVLGQVDQSGTWSCVAPDSSDCSAALDVGLPNGSGGGTRLHNRSAIFTAPATVGRYKLIYTSNSVYDGTTASQYAWVYVGGAKPAGLGGTTAFPLTADHTEATACFADPAFTKSYTVKADGTGDFAHIYQLPFDDQAHQTNNGFIGRVFNLDTTGSAPTQYPEWFDIRSGGTRDVPVVICGVPDTISGHNPVLQGNNSVNTVGDAYDGTTRPGSIITLGKFAGGYLDDFTSVGPDYVNLWGFNLDDAGSGSDGRYIGIWVQSGRHFSSEGMAFNHLRDSIYMLSNSSYIVGRHTEFQSVIGDYFQNCGVTDGGGSADHCVYSQGTYPLFVGDYVDNLIPGSGGSWLKIRGGGSIVAATSFHHVAGYANIFWGNASDDSIITNVDMFLGAPGDTNCDDSLYCRSLANPGFEDIHTVMNFEESLAHDYFYGNTLPGNNGAPFFSYSSQGTPECSNVGYTYCTNGDDHTGGFMVWNNTFDRPGPVAITNNVFWNNISPEFRPGVNSWPFVTYQNNAFWTNGTQADGTTGFPLQIDLSTQFQGAFKTNLFNTGSIKITSPINPGDAGWGSSVGGAGGNGPMPIWSDYAPKDPYLVGISSSNFIFTPSIPYNTTDYKPTTGSPLISAGSPIADPLMAVLPVELEPDPVNGFVVPRTDNGATIGARASTAAITVAGTPSFTPDAGTYTSAQSVTIASSTSGAVIHYTTDGSTPSATVGTVYSGPVSVAASLTLKAIASASGLTDSSVASAAYVINITTPTAATPTCSPAAGTYTSAQTVSCSSTTPSSTTYCTVDGTTPTTASPVCTSIAIGSTRTLKAISAASGDTNSAVLTQAYTINIPSTLAVATTSLPSGTVNSTYPSTQLAATGGTGPYTWVQTSGATFPPGLTVVSGGTISGIPTTAGTYSGLVFRVTDSLGATADSGSLTITIAPAVSSGPGSQSIGSSSSIGGGTTY